jgi:hypothetical protein
VSTLDEACGEFHGDVFPVPGCCSGSDNCSGLGIGQDFAVASDPQRERGQVA